MVLRSLSIAAATVAAALTVAGCSAPETDDSDATPSPTASDAGSSEPGTADGEGTDAPDASAEPSGPQVEATTGAIVDGLPSVLAPLPDAEIVSSSVQPAGDGQPVVANLTMRTTESVDDVLGFYADHFDDADFSPVGDPQADSGITTQSYHADDAGQLVSVAIAEDAEDDDTLLVTIGGQVLP
ncbi:hypothetical protein [Brevibacterium yomogidense]|uniref:hypothetical protein n=1 Tax=Brevibacterium yomogidense TaxID=946573 RepID=UPI0018DF5037|nr:hypothetical protein [Brevibacterium yomogidense]